MFKKYLEKRFVVDSYDEVVLAKPVELEYYLIESYDDNIHMNEAGRTYGIGIVQKIDESCYEEKVVRNYSRCPDETRSVLATLASNSVTPDTLMYVLDDLLDA